MPWWIRKSIAWVLLGSPALYATYLIAINDLGANPLETLMFNGYSDEVADLYRGMDLTKFY